VISRLPDCPRWKLSVRRLQFLKTDDVGFGFAEPVKQVREAAMDIVNVEAGYLHRQF
jgi:hypothetical protein